MKNAMIIIGVILVVILAVTFVMMNDNSSLKGYLSLKDPKFSEMKDEKMIEVTLQGDPNQTAGKGIGMLYGTFFQLKKYGNELNNVAPRARWPVTDQSKKETWTGVFGLPVSEAVKEMPPQKSGENTQVKLTTWEYGTVAEILHIGPYNREKETINKLKQFITDQGYEITGDHEEEYLKGPGMLPLTLPSNYYTIIRYRVRKL
jgi:hypothetical protein